MGLATAVLLVLSHWRNPRKATQTVLLAVLAFGMFALNNGVAYASYNVAHDQVKTQAVGGFHQSLNASLDDHHVHVENCHQDRYLSNCEHRFPCDSYQESHVHTDTDRKGRTTTTITYTTEWESCPVATKEFTYTVADSVGNKFTIAADWFDANPVQYRSERDGETDSFGSVKRGIPPAWAAMRDAIDAGDSPPTLSDNVYENILIGSDSDEYGKRKDDINTLKSHSLLPPITANLSEDELGIHDRWLADKMTFAGMPVPANNGTWQDRLMRANSGVGMTLHGDIHIAAIKASALPAGMDPEAYIQAWKAYTQHDFGKMGLPKNAIIIALGIDDSGTRIQWGRAETGMPGGNYPMLDLLGIRLHDASFDPDTVLGNIRGTAVHTAKGIEMHYNNIGGIVPTVVMHDIPFQRVCMSHCTAPNEKGQHGYLILKDLIPISTSAVIFTMFVNVLIAAAILGLLLALYYWVTKLTPFPRSTTEPPSGGPTIGKRRFA
jgi:hypothetical protein